MSLAHLCLKPLWRVGAVVGFALGARMAAAQGVPGAQSTDPPGSFTRLVRAGVDSTLLRWQKAAEAGDGAALARLYATDAVMYPTYGNPIHGRRAIGDALTQAVARVTHPRFSIDRLDASGDLASVVVEMTYLVALDRGGSYERRERMQLTMTPQWNVGWTIATQSGGDLAPRVAWVAAPRRQLAVGQGDTVTVRVTDALGGGIRDVLVAFEADSAGGVVWPAAVRTNARGEATAYRSAPSHPGISELRATAAIAPEDALLTTLTTVELSDQRTTSASGHTAPIP